MQPSGALFTCGATAARRAVENPRSFEGNQILEREEGALHSIRLGMDANKLPTKRNQKKVGPDEKRLLGVNYMYRTVVIDKQTSKY